MAARAGHPGPKGAVDAGGVAAGTVGLDTAAADDGVPALLVPLGPQALSAIRTAGVTARRALRARRWLIPRGLLRVRSSGRFSPGGQLAVTWTLCQPVAPEG